MKNKLKIKIIDWIINIGILALLGISYTGTGLVDFYLISWVLSYPLFYLVLLLILKLIILYQKEEQNKIWSYVFLIVTIIWMFIVGLSTFKEIRTQRQIAKFDSLARREIRPIKNKKETQMKGLQLLQELEKTKEKYGDYTTNLTEKKYKKQKSIIKEDYFLDNFSSQEIENKIENMKEESDENKVIKAFFASKTMLITLIMFFIFWIFQSIDEDMKKNS